MLATFAAGCFWGVEDIFRAVPGVRDATVGYIGGHIEHPTYEQVCSGNTGHAEGVEVDYDETKVNYDQLLDIFFQNHNPTTKNRQGPDIGHQYRSAIFFHTPEQEAAAKKKIEELTTAKRFGRPIVTEVVPTQTFWKAEEYHQQYLKKHGLSNCHI